MDCNDVRGRLHGYLDQELERSSASELERHLDSCDACRSEVARFSAQISANTSFIGRPPPPNGEKDRLWLSFRGAGDAREPGIYEHGPEFPDRWMVFLGSGPAPSGHPGTTL